MKINMIKISALMGAIMLFTLSCHDQNSTDIMAAQDINDQNSIFPRGVPNTPDYFTGEAYLFPMVEGSETDGYYSAGSVTFMPGARTYWHTHPSVQVLVVTEGKGWYQQRGQKPVKLLKGSVISIPIGIEHWHGATADSKLVHIHITNYKERPCEMAQSGNR